MKRLLFFFALLLALMLCDFTEAASKCCPPPPSTTGIPTRLSPRRSTVPPSSYLTLPTLTVPPTSHIVTGLPSNTVPITATTNNEGTRTFVSGAPSGTNAPSNYRTSGSGNTRPVVNPSGGGNGSQTPTNSANPTDTAPPLPSLPGPTISPIITPEFCWEDWWAANNSGLLVRSATTESEEYTRSNLSIADVPQLVSLYAYRGLFEDGIVEMATENLRGIAWAEELVAQIALGKYRFKKGELVPSIGNPKDYEYMAIRALGHMGGVAARETLAAVLVRDTVYGSDHTVGAPAEEALTEVISRDRDVNKRFWACIALGQLKDPRYIAVLSNVANSDGNSFVRAAACEGIAMIGGPGARKALEEAIDGARYYQAKAYAVASLGFLGAAEPVEEVRAALAAKNGEVRIAGAFALAHLISLRITDGKPHGELLAEYLKALRSEPDDSVRPSIALGMFLFASPAVLSDIEPFATWKLDPAVRAVSAVAIGLCGSPDAATMLSSLPVDEDPAVETARAFATGFVSTGNGAKLALDMLALEGMDALRASGVITAAMLGGDDSYRRVYELRLHKGDAIVRRAVSFACAAYLGGPARTLNAGNVRSNDAEKRSLAMVGAAMRNDSDALDMLSSQASSRVLDARLCYDVSMGLMGGLPLVARIGEALDDGVMQVRSAAAVALGSLNRPEQISVLLDRAVSEKDERARGYAIAGLLGIRVPEADVPTVVATLAKVIKTDRYITPRAFAVLVLSRFPDSREAYDAVRMAIDDKAGDVRAMAAISLGLFRNPSALREIRSVMADGRGTPLKYAATIGLGLLGDDTGLERMISEFEYLATGEEYEATAFAIAKCSKKDTYAQMLKYLESTDVYLREYTVKAFGMMSVLDEDAQKEIRGKLAAMAKDEDMQVRFYSGVVRYALGDREGLRLVLDTVTDNSFYMAGRVGADYKSLQKIVNTSLPAFYRIPPYFWEETE